ncbi:MAG TPA: 50S ribosomal protein L11 methyltransferase [Rhodocyclaceae bacterium]|nr:50S ribosomal protein L11 methyltransferase [Rhodocyclaceae bacterium]
MSWLSVSLITDASHAEALADAITEAGALTTSIEDADAGTAAETPQFDEPGEVRPVEAIGWTRSKVVALFDPLTLAGDSDAAQHAALQKICADAALAVGLKAAPPIDVVVVEEQDWVRLTQSQFDPIRISDRLWIVPSWHEAPNPDAICIALDPGLAFGTGSHPTTRLCLQWLEQVVTPGVSVLDYGCGSGILAIAAGKLGATPLEGVDIDPRAIESAAFNAENNGVTAHFALAEKPSSGVFDIVVANILANPLRALAPALAARVRPGGRLALSGILREQAEEIIAIYAPWAKLDIFGEHEGWVCLAGHRHDPAPEAGTGR